MCKDACSLGDLVEGTSPEINPLWSLLVPTNPQSACTYAAVGIKAQHLTVFKLREGWNIYTTRVPVLQPHSECKYLQKGLTVSLCMQLPFIGTTEALWCCLGYPECVACISAAAGIPPSLCHWYYSVRSCLVVQGWNSLMTTKQCVMCNACSSIPTFRKTRVL